MNIELEIKSKKKSEKEERVHPTERDKKAVLFVVQQGFATIEQLWKAGWADQRTASYAYERLALLERVGFLSSFRLELSPLKVYRATGMGRYLVTEISQSPIPMTDLPKAIALHQLGLNEIRLALESRGVDQWRSAESLTVDPVFKKIGQRHIPDGFYINSKGVRTVVEFDRTLRKRERIKDRLSSYIAELSSPDRSIDRLVYLVSPGLESTYRLIFEREMSSFKDRTLLLNINDFLHTIKEGAGRG